MISYIEAGILHYTQSDATAAEEGEDLDAVTSALEEQAARLAELAKEANLEFNQLRLSLEKALQKSKITETVL